MGAFLLSAFHRTIALNAPLDLEIPVTVLTDRSGASASEIVSGALQILTGQALTDEEITAIENGIANVDYQDRTSLNDRLRQAIWEIDWYSKNYNPTGPSVTMRLEFRKQP